MPDETRAPLADPLWVPPITHYAAPGRIDAGRWRAMIRALSPNVRQFLIGGSTGDGWELDDRAFTDLVRTALAADCFDRGAQLLFGILRADTDAVIARALLLETLLARARPAAGIAVCPPIVPGATQAVILEHYRRVLAATTLPIAIYELPQVTGCSLAPATLAELAADPRIIMFKDTSGQDIIAPTGAADGIIALRGAEGKYAEMLRPRGPYDGWLLSTGNAFSGPLRRIADLLAQGERDSAQALSDQLSGVVLGLFQAASALPFGNAFSNANRAGDHVLAHGAGWPDVALPRTISGTELPRSLIEHAAAGLASLGTLPERGYLEG